MAWEERSGNRYYYRKKRIGSRVVSEYIGGGYYADLIALEDEQTREQQAEAQEAHRHEEVEYQAIEQQLAQAEARLSALVAAELLAAGYHPHKGQWRLEKTKCP